MVVLGGDLKMDLENCQQFAPHEDSRITKKAGEILSAARYYRVREAMGKGERRGGIEEVKV